VGCTGSPTEVSTRNLPIGKGQRPEREADSLIVNRLSRECESLDGSQTYGPPRSVTDIILASFAYGSHNREESVSVRNGATGLPVGTCGTQNAEC
jgi:hypothetical protein